MADRLLFWALVIDVLLLALAGGPPPGMIATAVFVLAAVTLTALLAISRSAQDRHPPALLRILLIAMVALPALQLVPLPPALWRSLPGGDLREDVLSLVGAQQDWQPMSLVPVETAGTVLLAFGFVMLITAMIALRDRRFEQLLIVLGLVGLANIGIGIAQAASGGSPQFLTKADHGALLGFFANKNHAGLAIAASLALFVYLTERLPVFRTRRGLWLSVASVFAVVCAVPTNSRAGVVLTLGVATWIALRFAVVGKSWTRIAVVGGSVVLAGLLSLSPVFDRVYHRFDDVGQDLRWRFIQQSEPLIHDHALLGAGGGSFSRMFIVNEKLAWVKPTFVNELHNEYLQTLIEYGAPGVALLLVMAAALAWTGWTSWRQSAPGSAKRRQLEVGVVIIVLFAMHSAIDYPLRRPATWALFAAGCALVVRNGPSVERSDGRQPTLW